MSDSELLLYRSNLLGSDKRITNCGGGNTSAKVIENDPLTGESVEVLWVKGSGGDLNSIKLDGFATLYMDKRQSLKGLYRGVEFEDEMLGSLPHCTFDLNARAASQDYQALTAEIFGTDIGWLPWKKPGFKLGLWLETFCIENPNAKGVVLESHGLFTWDDDASACDALTVNVIQQAMD